MSLGSFLNKLFGGSVGHFIVQLGEEELKIAENSTLGVAIVSAIHAGEAGSTPLEKIGLAISSLVPTIKTYVTDPATLESDLETTARLMIEAALAKIKVTGPLAIFKTIAELI
jgi:hypothetical protein